MPHSVEPAARRPLLALLAIAACSAVSAASGVEVELHARAVAPGEPVRLVVSGADIGRLEGSFLGRDLAFQPDGDGRWAAWSLVPLDAQAGPAALAVAGETTAGEPIALEREVAIEPREFPEERLEVSSRYVEPPPEVRARLASERERLQAIYRSRTPLAPGASAFVRPVPGEPTSVFGTRRLFNGEPRSPHPGLDLRASTGTPVRSAGPGRVVLAGDLYYSGNTVVIDHGGGLFTLYAHLSTIDVADGEDVEAGDRLGLSGATGRVTGPHLHWGAKIGDEPFDPRALLDPELFR